jgi:hypothetical protein
MRDLAGSVAQTTSRGPFDRQCSDRDVHLVELKNAWSYASTPPYAPMYRARGMKSGHCLQFNYIVYLQSTWILLAVCFQSFNMRAICPSVYHPSDIWQ